MRKIISTLVIMVLGLSLIGCGNSLVKKSIEQAIVAIEDKNYDKALVALELALDEDKENKEVSILYSIVANYVKANKLVDENKTDEAQKILGEIDSEYNNYAIKEDIESLKAKIDEHNKQLEIMEEENQQSKGKKDEYIEKLNMVEEGLSDLSYLFESGVTVDLVEAEGKTLKRWDDMLNEIYSLLKVQLTEKEMDELTDKQINWISYRDKTAKNDAATFEGGSFARVQYSSTLARLTKERCYELVNTYMN